MEENSYLHCDIAARNVLLSSASPVPVAKLGDFGLSYQIRPHNANNRKGGRNTLNGTHSPHPHLMTFAEEVEYLLACNADRVRDSGKPLGVFKTERIPIKWTAIESIKTRVRRFHFAELSFLHMPLFDMTQCAIPTSRDRVKS